MQKVIQAKGGLTGKITVPGDKSISHRAAMLGALARGRTVIHGFLRGADCLSTLACLRQLGVQINELSTGEIEIWGRGLASLHEPSTVLDAGNSGTTMRLMAGILAGAKGLFVLSGDSSLNRRPMARIIQPLTMMGGRIWGRDNHTLPPLAIYGEKLRGIVYQSPVSSAQVKSAILLAGLGASGQTTIIEPTRSRDHTERMIRGFGGKLSVNGTTVSLAGPQELTGCEITVPGDISSAAFWLVAGAIVPGSELMVSGVGLNPTRTGIVDVLQQMGARLEITNYREVAGEPVGDVKVKGDTTLRGITIAGSMIPRLVDEIPVIAVAALVAKGETIIKDAAELRVKESDRLALLASILKKMGATVTENPDGLVISGGVELTGITGLAQGDHRIAMATAIAGLIARGETTVLDSQCVDVSYPSFWTTLAGLR